tara:strand:- start:1727 stop:1906 length:180 start_codon:yes stop_codon:yes gene_type:complete
MKIKKGDLVFFKPEYNDDNWADRLAVVMSFDEPLLLTLLSKGDIVKAPIYTVEKVKEKS